MILIIIIISLNSKYIYIYISCAGQSPIRFLTNIILKYERLMSLREKLRSYETRGVRMAVGRIAEIVETDSRSAIWIIISDIDINKKFNSRVTLNDTSCQVLLVRLVSNDLRSLLLLETRENKLYLELFFNY